MEYSLPGSPVRGILQARILEWVAISFSKESSQPKDQTHVSYISCIAGIFFTHWAIGEAKIILILLLKLHKWKTGREDGF